MEGRCILMQIIRGKIPCAKKVVVYGPEGIGKSTFASRFPEPLFIDTEGSTKDMDVSRFEKASSWPMLMSQVRYVKENPGICKTLVIDTADWAEQMCVADLCARHGKKGVEDFGYGNGYVYAKEEFGRFLNALEEVVEKGVNVVITAHAQMRKFEQPDEMGSYDRWEMKLGKKTSSQTSPLVKEWADMVLFCNYKTIVVNVDGQGAQKGKNKAQGGKRVMYTTHHICWDAKNRYGLPDEVPFDYSSISHIIEPSAGNIAMPAIDQVPVSGVQEKMNLTPEIPKASKSTEKPAEKTKAAPSMETKPESVTESPTAGVDPRIPKNLRDLMVANQVDEWDIQNVVAARGYFPADMEVRDYPKDFIDGCLVAAWEQVYKMVREMKEKDALVFN